MVTASRISLIICCWVTGTLGDGVMRVVDLTHTFSPDTVYWPGDTLGYNFTELARGQLTSIKSCFQLNSLDYNVDREQNEVWVGLTAHTKWVGWTAHISMKKKYEANYIATPEHGGTHLDSPAHFYKGSLRTQQISMEKLVGPGVVINVKKAAANPDYRVTVDDVKAWETKYGRIPNGAIVLMNSGWDKKYPNKTLTFGTTSVNNPAEFHFPGFHEDAADWIATYRNVHVLGVDTPSTDYGQSKLFFVHKVLGKANIPGLENVANLDRIPEHGAMVYAPVMKIFDGSGGPTRAFATFTEDDETNAASHCWCSIFYMCISVLFSTNICMFML